MKIGKFAYKMGFSFTNRESRLQNKNFIYQMGFLAFKRESRFATHQFKNMLTSIFVNAILDDKKTCHNDKNTSHKIEEMKVTK